MQKWKRWWMVAGTAMALTVARGDDWPQWRGPERTGISKEKGLLQSWDGGQPRQLWTVDTPGEGYAAPAVVDNRIYITGSVGDRDRRGELYALSTVDGSLLWRVDYGAEWGRSYTMSRTTPTCRDGRLYVYSSLGVAGCFDAKTGESRWTVDTLQRFKGRNITWGIAESPLLVDNLFICHPGGPDAAVVALDVKSGDTVWTSRGLSEPSAYCSPIVVPLNDRKMIVTQTADHIVGIDAADGTVLWKSPQKNRHSVHPNTPVVFGDKIFISSGYGYGSRLLGIRSNGLDVEVLWKESTLDNHFQGLLYVQGRLFGSRSRGPLVCLDPADGRVVYEVNEARKASILYADNRLYAYSEGGGKVHLIDVRPNDYAIKGTFAMTAGQGPHWAHPALADGVLYIRHGKALSAYDVKAD